MVGFAPLFAINSPLRLPSKSNHISSQIVKILYTGNIAFNSEAQCYSWNKDFGTLLWNYFIVLFNGIYLYWIQNVVYIQTYSW